MSWPWVSPDGEHFTLCRVRKEVLVCCSPAKAIIAVDLFKDYGKGGKYINIKGNEVALITSRLLSIPGPANLGLLNGPLVRLFVHPTDAAFAQAASRSMASSTSATSASRSTQCSRPALGLRGWIWRSLRHQVPLSLSTRLLLYTCYKPIHAMYDNVPQDSNLKAVEGSRRPSVLNKGQRPGVREVRELSLQALAS